MSPDSPPEGAAPPRRRRLYEPLEPAEPFAVDAAARDVPRGAAGAGKEATAARIVRKYVYWSGGLGLLALPVLSTAAVLGAQLKMLSELSALYGVAFAEQRGKALIASLAGGLVTVGIGRPLLAHALAVAFPPWWPVFQAASSGAAAAATYAVGRVFTHHFELGGTLLDFSPESTRAFFEREFRGARGGRE